MATRLIALASALLLLAAQVSAADDPADIAAEAAAAAKSAAAQLKKAEGAAKLGPNNVEEAIEADIESSLRQTMQELNGLNATSVMNKVAPWHSVDELEAHEEKAFAKEKAYAKSERDRFVKELEALPRNATANSTKNLLASARKAEEELYGLEKSQTQAMHHALRQAEHAARAQVRSLERSAFHSAKKMRMAGSKIEKTARKMKTVPEHVYERTHDKLDDTSEMLSSKAEYVAERLEDELQDRYEDLADQVRERIHSLRKRGSERHKKAMAMLAEKQVAKKQGAKATSFLGVATSSTEAMGAASFMAGVLASMVGTFAVIRRSRLLAPVSEAPLLG